MTTARPYGRDWLMNQILAVGNERYSFGNRAKVIGRRRMGCNFRFPGPAAVSSEAGERRQFLWCTAVLDRKRKLRT